MDDKILLFSPIFKDRIWGGTKLRDAFGYDIPTETTGEAWTISAHKDGSSIVTNGKYAGKTLEWLYSNHRELFSNISNSVFPLLVKIIYAKSDLSVQVHPNDEGAKKYHDLGKTECWYILDCPKNAKLIYGHNAKTKEEFRKLVNENRWHELLKEVEIKKGDFIFVPAGKIHALTKETTILEIQQSSNITFRLYDYNRLDSLGNPRELHIEESIEASFIPDVEVLKEKAVSCRGKNRFEVLVRSPFFTVEKWTIKEPTVKLNPSFVLATVIKGEGQVNGISINKGDNFIVTSQADKINLDGNFEVVISYIENISK